MRVQFVERENGPERLVCEAELMFEARPGRSPGMKLVGFSLWRSAGRRGLRDVSVAGPSAPATSGASSTTCGRSRATAPTAKRVKDWILDEFRTQRERGLTLLWGVLGRTAARDAPPWTWRRASGETSF